MAWANIGFTYIKIACKNHFISFCCPFSSFNSCSHFLPFLKGNLFSLWANLVEFMQFSKTFSYFAKFWVILSGRIFFMILCFNFCISMETFHKLLSDEIVCMYYRLFANHVKFWYCIIRWWMFNFDLWDYILPCSNPLFSDVIILIIHFIFVSEPRLILFSLVHK